MRSRPLLAACLVAVALSAFALGVAFEHRVGTAAFVESTGLDRWMIAPPFRSAAQRTRVPFADAARGRTMVALVFGQSNAGNNGESRAESHPGVYEFYRGQLYVARDPLLEASGTGGSIWLRLAAKLVERGDFDSVVLVPLAAGSTEIARWAPGGSLGRRLRDVIANARESGLTFTHLLWQQGEADAIDRTPGTTYRDQFLAMLAVIRHQGVDAPIYVARASRCARVRPSDEIREAQRSLVDPGLGVRAGPDTDALGFAERYDGCHFSVEGLDRAADLWLQALDRGPSPPGR